MMEDMRHNSNNLKMEERQLWNNPRASSTSSSSASHCTPFVLPSGGILELSGPDLFTLTDDVVFQPACTGSSGVVLTGTGSPLSLTDFKDPFYASTLPECYALAATTVIAYMLVIMLLITPRTFLHEGAVVLGRRGFTNGPSGANNGIGIGGRPWLQKVAACSVAIALTIATADTFAVAEHQYNRGFMDAALLQDEVEKGLELRIFRVISDTFLWLAQAQTLIRLFPRQREKIIIKWTAFSLITLDVIFSILNNFYFKGGRNPRNFVEALPALSYLFQLSLSLLYCAWVIYYSLTKKRFAFYHQQMRNQCLVALLSLISVLIPVVFFVVDISKPEVAGWGDYVRWVGAAAASVVVWEWVERIEALERNEKKDGVLGREVFDGDEMLDSGSKSISERTGIFQGRGNDDDEKKGGRGSGSGGVTTSSKGISWPGVAGIKNRYRPRTTQDLESGFASESMDRRGGKKGTKKKGPRPRPPLWPTRPAPAATPVSRTDTASAQSTVYAVRYHPLSEGTPVRDRTSTILPTGSVEDVGATADLNDRQDSSVEIDKPIVLETEEDQAIETRRKPTTWDVISKANPFRKRNQGPPLEVSAHAVKLPDNLSVHGSSHRWDVRAKIEDFAVTQAERIRDKARGSDSAPDLPVTIIPAPTRRLYYEAALGELEERSEHRDEYYEPPQDQSEPVIPRSGDPYKPDDFNGHSVHQRGAISFITAVPQDRISAPTPEPMPPMQPIPPISRQPSSEGRRDAAISPFISRSSPVQLRSPSSPILSVAPRNDGLAIMSIPAPARRPRSDSDSS